MKTLLINTLVGDVNNPQGEKAFYINPQHWVSISKAEDEDGNIKDKVDIDGRECRLFDIEMTNGRIIKNVTWIGEVTMTGIGRDYKEHILDK